MAGPLHRFLVATSALLTALGATAPARRCCAQIFNVHSLMQEDASQGFSGALDGSKNWRTGNVNLRVLSASGALRYRQGPSLLVLLAQSDLGFSGDAKIINRHIQHLRFRREILGPIDAELFAQHSSDEFRQLESRMILGLGPRVRLFEDKRLDLAVALAYMPEYERLTEGLRPPERPHRVNHRLSAYATVYVHLADRLRLGQTLYVQPRVDLWSDFNVLSETELVVSITRVVALRLASLMSYASIPALGVVGLDTTRNTSLRLRF